MPVKPPRIYDTKREPEASCGHGINEGLTMLVPQWQSGSIEYKMFIMGATARCGRGVHSSSVLLMGFSEMLKLS